MRWGEPVVVYDSGDVEKSRRNLDTYMRSNGWFKAKTAYTVNYRKRTATVNYTIVNGKIVYRNL